MDFKALLGLARKPKTPIAEVEAALAKLDIDEAESEVARLEEARRIALADGDVQKLRSIDDQIKEANYRVELTVSARAELVARLDQLKSEDAESARRVRFEDVRKKARRVEGIFGEYQDAALRIVALIGELAELEAERDRVNADLPKGEQKLPGFEFSVRGYPEIPVVVEESQLADAWYFEGKYNWEGEVPQKEIDRVRPTGTSSTIQIGTRLHNIRKCKRVSKRECRRPPLVPRPISATLNLPGLSEAVSFWKADPSNNRLCTAYNWDEVATKASAVIATPPTKNEDKRPIQFENGWIEIIPY